MRSVFVLAALVLFGCAERQSYLTTSEADEVRGFRECLVGGGDKAQALELVSGLAERHKADPAQPPGPDYYGWLAVEDQTSAAPYQRFLEMFPDSSYVKRAKARLL